MDFFSKLGETLSATGRDVSQKAKDLTGLAKLNMDVRSKEEYILKQYTEIGKQYYELHKKDTDPVFAEIPLITEALEEIDRLKEEIADLKGLKKCPACGAMIEAEAVFCKQCGQKYESAAEEVVTGEVVTEDKAEEQ